MAAAAGTVVGSMPKWNVVGSTATGRGDVALPAVDEVSEGGGAGGRGLQSILQLLEYTDSTGNQTEACIK